MRYLLLPLLSLCFAATISAQVVINEYSASNLDDFTDQYLKYEDWIELYNMSDQDIDLSGYFLSDKVDNVDKYEIPAGTIIGANDHLRFWCSGRNEGIHTSFKLTQTKDNEFVVLADPDLNILDSRALELTFIGMSRARDVDGSGSWKICPNPTPNSSNAGSDFYNGFTEEPVLDQIAGFYDGQVTVAITTEEPNATIRYTIDGRDPDENSPVYTEPLTIDKTTVVKAATFVDDPNVLPGKMAFATYFIDESFTLPVFSVAGHDVKTLANGNDALRPRATVEYFENEQLVSYSYGRMNKHGQDSWVNDHRSLDYVCRDEMGYTKAIDAKLFDYSDRTEHQRLMFRASGDDNYPATDNSVHEGSCHVRDEYVHTLALEGGMKLDVRAVRRMILFIDGEFWGVYGLRERPVDHDYTSEYYDQEKFDLQYLATWGWTWAEYGGDDAFAAWTEFRDFVLESDMSIPENYEYVKDNFQVLSLIDYMIANLNSVASDWLNYNTGWWRGTNPDGDHKKWGYILWDNDATFDYYINYSGVPNTNPDAVPCDIEDIADYMDQFFGGWGGGENNDVGKHEKIFLKLQEENAEFRQLYYSRQADLMNTIYTCDNMLGTLDSMIAIIAPEMPRQIARWGGSMEEWESNVERLRNFIAQRCELLDDGMIDCFELEGPYPVTLLVEPEGAGEIDFNTLDIETFPWTGEYFGNMDNLIKAKSNDDDLEFLYWESKAGNEVLPSKFSRSAILQVNTADTLVAVFGVPSNVVNEEKIEGKLYPSPTQDVVTLDFDLNENQALRFEIFDMTGKKIMDLSNLNALYNKGINTVQFSTNAIGLAPGAYTLRLAGEHRYAEFKIIKID